MTQSLLALKLMGTEFLKAKSIIISMVAEGQRKLVKHLFSHSIIVISDIP